MQFKHPEFLYALFLLIIPIIIHLFQLRTFKKEAFTNVAFLKNVKLQTRKSSQLKKWLTLLLRCLILAALIFAFAQPYTSKTNAANKTVETVVYLDNSFSMQAKGANGVLLKRAVQDLLSAIPETQNLSLITNSNTYKNTSLSSIKNELLNIDFTPNQLNLNTVVLKSKSLFNTQRDAIKNLIYISDFQNSSSGFTVPKDTALNFYAVKLKPLNTNNIAIDSAYISVFSPTKLELRATLTNSGTPVKNVPVSLYNNNKLIAKTSTEIDREADVTFSLPANTKINGEIRVNDTQLQFDNSLFFNINTPEKIKVLSIGNTSTNVLKRIYTEDEFQFASSTVNTLNYNSISNYNLIVLDALERIPLALTSVLNSFVKDGGTLLVLPSEKIQINSYNNLLTQYPLELKPAKTQNKSITTINYSHPLYSTGVFEKRVKNFQYPKVSLFYDVANALNTPILAFEDGTPFLTANANVYIITAPISKTFSSFTNSPLIVPTFYNVAKNSFKIPQLYYNTDHTNTYQVAVVLQQDGVLSLEHKNEKVIPRQQSLSNSVTITTRDVPKSSGTYAITNNRDTLKHVSYNYSRTESHLNYINTTALETLTLDSSIADTFSTLKSNSKINALWKWFAIFALIFLVTEMLILKFFK